MTEEVVPYKVFKGFSRKGKYGRVNKKKIRSFVDITRHFTIWDSYSDRPNIKKSWKDDLNII